MKLIADLHIHSPYSRATSKDMTPPNLALWSMIKGINLTGTGDILHPKWQEELKRYLVPQEQGFFSLAPNSFKPPFEGSNWSEGFFHRFVLTGEISCIYKQGGKVRRVHHLIILPGFLEAEAVAKRLSKMGNITSDGRPILGIDSITLLQVILEAAPDAILVPAHVWTPWFSLFGAHSGFDSIQECFGELSTYVSTLETGLSSDPPMNRLISSLDGLHLISNSDAHSPKRLGREATLLDIPLSFHGLKEAVTKGKDLLGTLEFFPEEGKYHLDGHRNCGVRLTPEETLAHQGICPKCHRPLTKGVLYRVMELSDRKEPLIQVPYYYLIPLEELLAEINATKGQGKNVEAQYLKLVKELGPELEILLHIPPWKLEEKGNRAIRIAIERMRAHEVTVEAGYDGQYGRITVFKPGELECILGRKRLFQGIDLVDQKGKQWHPSLFSKPSVAPKANIEIRPNLEQKACIELPPSNILINAGPGTGKTFTLVQRILYLLRCNVPKTQLLCLTFTRKAKEELEHRIRDSIGESPDVFTFHGFCLCLLKTFGHKIGLKKDFVLLDEKEAHELMNQSKDFTDSFLTGESLEPKTLELLSEADDEVKNYLMRYRYLFIDEFQDTNPSEMEILKKIKELSRCYIFAIGDKHQAIYGFRNISSHNFEMFEDFFGTSIIMALKSNYRSQAKIVKAANSIIGESALVPYLEEGDHIFIKAFEDPYLEAKWIAKEIKQILGGTTLEGISQNQCLNLGFNDIAVIYRLNEIGEIIENELHMQNIPCIRFSKDKIIEHYPADLIYKNLSLLLYPPGLIPHSGTGINIKILQSLKENPGTTVRDIIEAFLEKAGQGLLLNETQRQVLDFILDLATGFDNDLKGFLEALRFETVSESKGLMGERVTLLSIHSAKGLEWEVVFLCGAEEGILPFTLLEDGDPEEEKRLFYVAVTRAKKRLYITHCKNRRLMWKSLQLAPSSFLDLLPQDVVIWNKNKRKSLVQLPLFWQK